MKETFENWRLFLEQIESLGIADPRGAEDKVTDKAEGVSGDGDDEEVNEGWLDDVKKGSAIYQGLTGGDTSWSGLWSPIFGSKEEIADKAWMAAAGDTSVPMGIRGKFQPGWMHPGKKSKKFKPHSVGTQVAPAGDVEKAVQDFIDPPTEQAPPPLSKKRVPSSGGGGTTVPEPPESAIPNPTGDTRSRMDLPQIKIPHSQDSSKPGRPLKPTGQQREVLRKVIDNVINELLDDSPQKRVGDPSYIQSIYEITIKVSIHKTRGGDREQTFTEIRGIPNVTVVSVDPTGTSRDETFYYSTLNCKFELSGNENAKEYLRLLFFPGIRDIKGLTLKHAGNLQKLL